MSIVEHLFGNIGAALYGGPQKIAFSFAPIATVIGTVFLSEIISLVDPESIAKHLKAGLTIVILCVSR